MHAALVAAQQGIGLAAPVYSIRVDGLELAGRAGAGYGVNPATVTVVEAGPGRVSECSFTVDDADGLVSVAQGQYVRMHDLVADMPVFAGWVESFRITRLGLGRQIDVACVGLEAVLDWAWVPSFTVPAGTDILVALQMTISAAWVPGVELRWAGKNSGYADLDYPVSPNGSGSISPTTALVVPAGSLRQAIGAVLDAWYARFAPDLTNPHALTVDFWHNVRLSMISTAHANLTFADYAVVATDVVADPRPDNTVLHVGSAQARHAVVTQGSDVTWVSDGSGIPGPAASVTGTAIVASLDARMAEGRNYLASQDAGTRGETSRSIGPAEHVTRGIGTTAAQRRAGSRYTHTEPGLGVTGLDTQIASIVKSFTDSGEEDWRISFGGLLRVSGSSLLRRTTPQSFI